MHPGITTVGLINPMQGFLEKIRPDVLVIHAGTNDLTSRNGVINTTEVLMRMKELVNENAPMTELIISLPTDRYDNEIVTGKPENENITQRTKVLRENMISLCAQEGIETISHQNVKDHHLGRMGLPSCPSPIRPAV